MSSVPAITFGWFAMMPTVRPSNRANPITMFIAHSGKTSRNSPSSTMYRITSCMSYGSCGRSGIMCVEGVGEAFGVVAWPRKPVDPRGCWTGGS